MTEPESIDTVLERQARIVSTLQKEVERKIGTHMTSDETEKLRSLSKALHYNTLVWQVMIEAASPPKRKVLPL